MLHPNDKAGPYTLVKFLGEGAFGQVWLAEKTTTLGTRLRVALKLLNLQLVDLEAIRQAGFSYKTKMETRAQKCYNTTFSETLNYDKYAPRWV